MVKKRKKTLILDEWTIFMGKKKTIKNDKKFKKMDSLPKNEGEPKLREFAKAYDDNLNRMELLTIDIRHKVRSLHNPPTLDPVGKPTDGEQGSAVDAISDLFCKNARLEMYNNRLEEIVHALNRII